MRTRRPLLAATLALVIAGCGDSSTGPRTDHLGVYDLTSVDGARLPVVLFENGDSYLAVTAGDMVLGPSNRATTSVTIEVANGVLPRTSQSLVCTGTHSRNGSRISINIVGSGNCTATTLDATLAGRTLTVSDESGTTLVYTKEP